MLDECTMLPRKSFSVLLLLKLWWPLQQQKQDQEQAAAVMGLLVTMHRHTVRT